MMTVAMLYEALQKVMDDGNGYIEIAVAIEGSGQGRHILDVDVYDEPVIISVSRSTFGATQDLEA
jgi:hypothetical protein